MATAAAGSAMAALQRFAAYERVSTARQGASGLGMEAQRNAIDAFAAGRRATILARFTEVESGKSPDRPELAKALHLSRVTGAIRAEGVTSLRGIAAELNARGMRTRRGWAWQVSNVGNLVRRLVSQRGAYLSSQPFRKRDRAM